MGNQWWEPEDRVEVPKNWSKSPKIEFSVKIGWKLNKAPKNVHGQDSLFTELS